MIADYQSMKRMVIDGECETMNDHVSTVFVILSLDKDLPHYILFHKYPTYVDIHHKTSFTRSY